MSPTEALDRMADAYNDHTDDGALEIDDTYDLLDDLIGLMAEAGKLTSCASHGWWATFRDQCPACNYCEDCDLSPCECDEPEPEEEDL